MFSFKTYLATLLCLVAVPASIAADIDVVVGGPGTLKFNPESVTANAGDVIRFSFRQKNHTATQSSLASPCTKLDGGFDSGFVPVPDSNTAGPYPVALYTVGADTTKPVWVYCAQGTHCSSAGMVFAINADGDKFAQFKAAATGAAPSSTAAATSSAATPSSTGPTDHKVVVGGPGSLAFSPNNIKPKAGDRVIFEFRQKNHTVTQSTFADPCTASNGGFDSGFMAVPDGSTTFPTWTVQINDTKPLWLYCKQGNHCSQGMVLAINSVDSGPNSFDAFQAKAKNGTAGAPTTPASPGGASRMSIGSGLALAMFGIAAGLAL